jgi:hypothetical protein
MSESHDFRKQQVPTLAAPDSPMSLPLLLSPIPSGSGATGTSGYAPSPGTLAELMSPSDVASVSHGVLSPLPGALGSPAMGLSSLRENSIVMHSLEDSLSSASSESSSAGDELFLPSGLGDAGLYESLVRESTAADSSALAALAVTSLPSITRQSWSAGSSTVAEELPPSSVAPGMASADDAEAMGLDCNELQAIVETFSAALMDADSPSAESLSTSMSTTEAVSAGVSSACPAAISMVA